MEKNIRINPLKYPSVKCECGSVIWNQGFILKKISGIALGAGAEDQLVNLPIYYCAKCGKPLPEDVEMYKLNEQPEEDKKPTIILQ